MSKLSELLAKARADAYAAAAAEAVQYGPEDEAVRAIVTSFRQKADTLRRGEITHAITAGAAKTTCCGRTPFELPRTDRLTTTGLDATCTEDATALAAGEDRQCVFCEGLSVVEICTRMLLYGGYSVCREHWAAINADG